MSLTNANIWFQFPKLKIAIYTLIVEPAKKTLKYQDWTIKKSQFFFKEKKWYFETLLETKRCGSVENMSLSYVRPWVQSTAPSPLRKRGKQMRNILKYIIH